jgi:cysteine-rich repeat protein
LRLLLLASLAVLLVACDDRSYSLGRPRQESSEGGEGGGSSGVTGVGGVRGGTSGAGGMGNGSSGGDVSLGGTGGKGAGGEAGAGSSGDAGAGGDVVEPGCGNGVTEPPEETCDDANRTPGDGCSAECGFEPIVVSASQSNACALSSAGSVKCWGAGFYGQLGLGDTDSRGDEPGEMGKSLPVASLGVGKRATYIVTGLEHACVLLDDASLKCWGNNRFGGLGLGDTDSRGDESGELGDDLPAVSLGTGRRALAVSAGGSFHNCVLFDEGSVKCWGMNRNGQLGLGDTDDRGDEPGEMGDDLPPVELGTGRRATKVVVGLEHTCALLDDASVKCWGANSFGQLGLGDTERRGDERGEMGDNLPSVELGSGRRARDVAVGGGFTCALLDDDSLKCWGLNAVGKLGLGDTEDRGDEPGEMGDNLPVVSLGPDPATSVEMGSSHVCVLLENRSVKCWGGYSGVGLGDTDRHGDEPGEMGDDLPAVSLGTGRRAMNITVGDTSSCAILDDSSVKCWGSNVNGRLGLGDTEARGDEPGEMGDNLPAVELGF